MSTALHVAYGLNIGAPASVIVQLINRLSVARQRDGPMSLITVGECISQFVETVRNWHNSVAHYEAPYKALLPKGTQ
jgi:hypothetical protein